ncbi:MAG: MFS transporter, partial [Chloroflexi bacterium]|nr:MFS transporter [Chloroflexota bacterium]
ATRPSGPFGALRYRDFRLLFSGMLISSLAMPMQWVAQMWLVIELADRSSAPLWLGITGFARGLPLLLLSLYGGVTADRMDRRRLLFLSQLASLVVAVAIGLFIAVGWINLWLVVVFALASSTVMSFDQPTRQALVPDLVRRDEVANAVALNSMAMFGAMAIGPALSGFLIEWIGLAGTYFFIASTYLGVMLAVTLMRTVSHPSSAVRRSMVAEVREGLAYVRGEPVVLWLISATFAITMLGMSFTNLAPVLIKDVLGSNAKGLGLTFAAWGVGAVAASLVLALGLVGFAYSRNLWMASLFQLVPGASNTVFMVIGNAAILSVTPPAVRGRVMGIYMMNRGLMPVGALAAGVLGGLLGVQAAIAILGVATFAAVVAVTLLQPGAWRRVDAAIAAGTGATL